MNKLLLFIGLVFLCAPMTIKGQNVAINKDGSNPHSSAMLDVSASDAGMLIPRMSEAQRNDIASPARGLLIYQTDQFPGFWYYTGSIWTPIYNSLYPYIKETHSTDSLNCTVTPTRVPGMADTIVLVADAKVVIEVYGAIQAYSNDKDKFATANISIYEDGAQLGYGGTTKVYAQNDNHGKNLYTYEHFSLKTVRTLSAGTYVFEVMAQRAEIGGESLRPTIGGTGTSPRAASMITTIIYE